MIYIFDIDGTLADITHRLHFIQKREFGDKPRWREFHAACVDDVPIDDVLSLCRLLAAVGIVIVYVTGRSDECREATVAWLKKHQAPTWARKVYMRKAGDHRPDHVVKSELLDEVIRDFSEDSVAAVFEDRKQVVDMYRAKGLRVFQVAEGNF